MSFAAEIHAWANEVEGALETIFKESVQELAATMQTPRKEGGRMPTATNFLRASLLASTASMPSINPEANNEGNAPRAYSPGPIEAIIAGAELNDTIFMGYTAAYAARMEYGFTGHDSLGRYYQQPGYAFVRTAAQQWPEIVRRQSMRLSATLAFS